MSNPLSRLFQQWVEYRGRNAFWDTPTFDKDQVISRPDYLKVSSIIEGAYIYNFPATCPILVSTDGKKIRGTGGYLPLKYGGYYLYYIDIREKTFSIPELLTITLDSVQLNIKASFKYQVKTPELIFDIQEPVQTLQKDFINALQHFFQGRSFQSLSSPALSEELLRKVVPYLPTRYFVISNLSVSFYKVGAKNISNIETPAPPEKIINIFIGGDISGTLTIGDSNNVSNKSK
ncbi:MAG TPA: hypothetical protein PLQ75_05855 [Anaerolineales bacterium]|nr:hypothetical protein [Saprospiraceae bacterium]HNE03029.1 hypothetical protein [Anaerolineales bacterium]HNF94153.1 hypothetical protein [Anaerolineales bacterium]